MLPSNGYNNGDDADGNDGDDNSNSHNHNHMPIGVDIHAEHTGSGIGLNTDLNTPFGSSDLNIGINKPGGVGSILDNGVNLDVDAGASLNGHHGDGHVHVGHGPHGSHGNGDNSNGGGSPGYPSIPNGSINSGPLGHENGIFWNTI